MREAEVLPRHLQLHEFVLHRIQLAPVGDGDVLELEEGALEVNALLGVVVDVDAELLEPLVIRRVGIRVGMGIVTGGRRGDGLGWYLHGRLLRRGLVLVRVGHPGGG